MKAERDRGIVRGGYCFPSKVWNWDQTSYRFSLQHHWRLATSFGKGNFAGMFAGRVWGAQLRGEPDAVHKERDASARGLLGAGDGGSL